MDLRNVIRHELEHLMQSQDLMQKKVKKWNLMRAERDRN